MALLWKPDFCPTGSRGCWLEVDQGQNNLLGVRRFCAHHQSLKDGGLTDDQVFLAIRRSGMAKEAARWAAKLELMDRALVTKEFEGLPFTVDADGTIRVQSGMTGPVRTAMRNRAALAAATIEAVTGISAIVVD